MSQNLIPEIAKMLGVELGEEFEIKGLKGVTYKFIIDELIVCDDDTEHGYTTANMTLVGLIRGTHEIVKLPWKPTLDERYWTFTVRDCLGTWIVRPGIWGNHPIDIAMLDKGWVYRTKQEAEAALPDVAAEMGVDYEL